MNILRRELVTLPLAITIYQVFRFIKRLKKYAGLDSFVSYTSKLVCAARATESNRDQPLFHDPLARDLAGSSLVARKSASLEPQTSSTYTIDSLQHDLDSDAWCGGDTCASGVGGQALSNTVTQEFPSLFVPSLEDLRQRRERTVAENGASSSGGGYPWVDRPINRIVNRTMYIDGLVSSVITGVAHDPQFSWVCGPGTGTWCPAAKGCKQVVVLGAGMDTRPWRLSCLRGCSWYEVDMSDVLSAKRRALKANGAQTTVPSDTQHKYPLYPTSWRQISADLATNKWVTRLQQEGYDANAPSVWVCEGLLYYLTQEEVQYMLTCAANVSAPGSVLWCNWVDGVRLKATKQKSKGSVMAAFKSGLVGNRDQYFKESGWQLQRFIHYAHAALLYSQGMNIKITSISPDDNSGYYIAVKQA